MKQIPLPIGPDLRPTFENFLPGANAAAHDHLLRLAPGATPVYLWGPAGSGKTHLLHALADRWQRAGGRVAWLAPNEQRAVGDEVSLVIVDCCETLDAAAQQVAFAAFVAAGERNVPFVAAGQLPPVDLPLRDDLRSRLGWGHVFALQPLGDDEARAVLRRQADTRGILLSDEVLDYLLARSARDLATLSSTLDQIDRLSLARQRLVTLPLVRDWLAGERVVT